RQLMPDHLAEPVLADEQIPARQQRRRFRSEISPDQPAHFLHRIGCDLNLVLETGAAGFERLFEAFAFRAEQPAVVAAAQTFGLGDADRQAGLAMGTTLL